MNAKKVLFLCTGNYYRSRFAEHLFNHLAAESGLPWRADSRGLAVGRTKMINVGPASPSTLSALKRHGIPVPEPVRFPKMATTNDFAAAHKVVALDDIEHRPMMRQHFAPWADRILYWKVHDVPVTPPDEALGQIEVQVRKLVAGLRLSELPADALAVKG